MKLKNRELLRAMVGVGPEKTMSGRRLARYAEVHPSFIDHLLAGRRSSCEPRTATLIAQGLNLPLTVLFDPKEPSRSKPATKPQQKVAA